ncbi:MAG TPA: methylmalonyl Co-A mutase-associated GTPase MeaB [Gemmatimonadales bacterium]|nr:methylmalonyl Co-A mutase-associated GTPase MeaB [Gemmatimonadales bacterium]
MDADRLLADLTAGRPAALARAITMVENGRPGFEQLLASVHQRLGRAHRIGITGPPGAGKSTLTEALVRAYRSAGRSVAVVAVDPTSPFSGGALLGDRIRMESVALDDGVFIRSMATRGSLGGMAVTTREVCDILDAAGFDRVIIETVGVGQSEMDVSRAADSTVLVLVPESGDGIQTLKSGIMEVADLFVVNKSDRPGADKLVREIEISLGIRRGNAFRHVPAHHGARGVRRAAPEAVTETDAWKQPVIQTVASRDEGTSALLEGLEQHHEWLTSSGTLQERRRRRMMERSREVFERALKRWIWYQTDAESRLTARLEEEMAGRISPYEVAAEVLEGFKQGIHA